MEQVQQVQVHVAAAKLGDSRTLFDDLEAHRRELRGLRGFVSMSISRSIEAGGDTGVIVETRWRDQDALDEYLSAARTAESIIRSHADITVPDTLSARQLEAVDTAGPTKQEILVDRFTIALMVPLAIVGIGFAIIYSLSRVYLEMGSDGATPLAIIIAGSILLGAWYFAENRNAPTWQFAAVGGTVVALLVAGTVWAQVKEGPEHESLVEVTETPGGNETPTAPGEVKIELHDNEVRLAGDGGANPTIRVASGQQVPITNAGRAIHNLHVSPFEASICAPDGPSPCSSPARINGGDDATITFDVPPGTYEYRCDFHAADMHGTVEVGPPQAAAPGGAGSETPTTGAQPTPATTATP
jgi:plastocyanin/heme-degrading monooxygenase HmoA